MQDIRPTSLIIFGATGDLATRKLYPALLDLYLNDFLPTTFQIVGFSRKPFTHEAFRAQVQSALDASGHEHSQVAIRTFLEHVFYVQGDIDSEESYGTLRTFLEERDAKTSTCSNKLFYLAVPPTLYKEIFEKLSLSGLAIPCAPSTPESEKIWTRVLVEKPFGNNQDEAKNLDLLLGELFEESQIFRIDHYLGKETVQNIVAFRFSNSLLEPVWNAEHVEKIEIRVLEKGTAANRGAFYEGIGALADVGQNHLLQMLALSTMENPGTLDAESLHAARSSLLSQVEITPVDATEIVRGQYEGYQSEKGVDADSHVETYFKVRVGINSPRWRGVPIYLESGKALNEDRVDIRISFKESVLSLCPQPCTAHANVLTFDIQPHPGVSLLLWSKKPGFEFELIPTSLSFSSTEAPEMSMVPDAYERVLYDCIRGDQALFPTTREIQEEWRIIGNIRTLWTNSPLRAYAQKSSPDDIPKKNAL